MNGPKIRNPDIVETQRHTSEPTTADELQKERVLVDALAHEILASLLDWQQKEGVRSSTMASAVMHVFAHYALPLQLPIHVVTLSYLAHITAIQRRGHHGQRSKDAGDVQGSSGDDPTGSGAGPSD